MTFHLHRAERTDVLADGLADLLATPLGDPFDTEVVMVAALGTERWLSQRLSHRLGAADGRADGVSAGIRFVRPTSVVSELLGIDDTDPWRPEALTWTVLAEIEAALGEPWFATVARHLGQEHSGTERDLRHARRLAVARQIAGLLHSYARQRPQLTTTWTAGVDEDGAGIALPPSMRWQPELWRRVHARIDQPSPDERIGDALTALSTTPDGVDLPERISLFGHNRLPAGDLSVLAAVADHRDVHLWLPHPSPAAWAKLTGAGGIVARADDTDAERVSNPLVAALGRDVRELQRSLAAVAPDAVQDDPVRLDRPDTVLGRVQADIAADRPGAGGPAPAADDRSIQVHACHGRQRQVEVLRDVIVGLLQDDPTLQPRDIVMMVPDIETYAPLFQATFGLADLVDGPHHPGHDLRLMLADRAASRTNPLLALAVELLELALRGRLTVTEVLDLMSRAPVRRRFGFDDEALERITGWVESAGVRWGLDGDHRRQFGLHTDQNTWQTGIDRLVAGVVASEDPARPVGPVLPFDDVPSGDVDLVGRLVTFLDGLRRAVDTCAEPRPMVEWSAAIATALTDLAAVSADDLWQRQQVERELHDLDDDLTAVQLAEVAALVRDRWSGRPSRASFRTGTLTVCTMVPMRSVPHRVVCLVGLDDGDFPRAGHVLGDDVLGLDPLTGERDPRAEDRQLLLDAVMSATQTLVVTYTGADEHQGRPRPPAVPLGELLDQIRRTVGEVDVVTHHRLQPFDARNLQPGGLGHGDRPFSFDPAALAGARAARHPVIARPPFLPTPLPSTAAADLTLADLEWFVQNPIKTFWRSRLGVALPGDDKLLDEDLPIDLDGLQKWQIGQRLLDDAIRGVEPQAAWDAVRRAAMLPPGQLGDHVADDVGTRVVALVGGTTDLRSGEAETIEVDVALPDGRRLTGTIEGIHGDTLVTVTYSTVRAKHRLRDWVRLLALVAQRPDVAWTAHTAGKIGRGTARVITGPLPDPGEALGRLAELVDLRDDALTRPLPVPVDLAWAHASRLRTMSELDAADRTAQDWGREAKPWEPPAERDAPEIVRVWGAAAPFSALVADGFTTLAPRLCGGALDHQREATL